MGTSQGSGTGDHVFISYVREDSKRVDRLQGRLSAAGITVWRDTSDLWPGQDWRLEIRRAITMGLAFIACFSEHTERRSASFQNNELIWAVEEVRRHPPGRVWLLPVRFADCQLPHFDLGAGRDLDSLQRVDLIKRDWEPAVARLVAAVRNVRAGSAANMAPGGAGSGQSKLGLRDLFAGMFDRSPRRGADAETDVILSSTDAVYGATVPLRLAGESACPACRGTGAKPGTMPRVCPACGGTGQPKASPGSLASSEPCRECRGRGLVVDDPCQSCWGSGRAMSSRTVQARIPAGVKDGQRVRVTGKGAPGQRGGEAGDLYLKIHVE